MSSSLHFLIMNTIILLTSTLLHVQTLATAHGNESDHQALLAFKSRIKYDPQGIFSSWNDSVHFCKWSGVVCAVRHSRVTLIDLGSKGLVGSLSPYIGNLSFLRQIRLHNNTLQSTIPHEIGRLFRLQNLLLQTNSLEGEIPANLSGCFDLFALQLGYNKLVGKIPIELRSFTKLKYLSIHYNYLIGGIPSFIGNLTSLESLSVAYNALEGSIPHSLGQLKSLKFLGLGANNLSGGIPPAIFNLSVLNIFSLADNELHGTFPPDLGSRLSQLQQVQVWGNHFTGPIPVSLSNASMLEGIDMSQNNLVGRVLTNFGALQHLKRLYLFGNYFGRGETDDLDFLGSLTNCSMLRVLALGSNGFGGLLPNSLGNLSTQLTYFSIPNNQLSGSIPTGIGNLISLTSLNLCFNKFSGNLPSEIGKLQKLEELNLWNNSLSGELPSSLGNLLLLKKLYLQKNRLQGAIPSSIGNCQTLLVLNLSQNCFSGTIPTQLFYISSLSISLNLANNNLTGSLPSDIGNLKNLKELDLANNKLFGEFPSNLAKCSSLEDIYMEGNYFQGLLPPSLSSLRGIQNFDISRNKLSGQIPGYLGDFSLEYLNLSYNDFEGEIPIKGIFKNASAVSVTGNMKLCGGIVELHLPRCSTKEPKKKYKSLVLVLTISVVAVIGLTLILSSLFCFFKKTRRLQSSISILKDPFLQVSYENLLKATNGFSLANLIGVGRFSSVFKATLDQSDTIVAIKVRNLQLHGAHKSFQVECETLRHTRHRNLIKLLSVCSSVDYGGNDFKALVYDYIPNGSLERWLHSNPKSCDSRHNLQYLKIIQRVNIAINIAYALDYLHQYCPKPVIHCDLKPSNILLDENMVAHVGDFGLAKILSEFVDPNQSSSIGIRGTIGYVAPGNSTIYQHIAAPGNSTIYQH